MAGEPLEDPTYHAGRLRFLRQPFRHAFVSHSASSRGHSKLLEAVRTLHMAPSVEYLNAREKERRENASGGSGLEALRLAARVQHENAKYLFSIQFPPGNPSCGKFLQPSVNA
ncbi:hypothetical protein BV898_18584 [Hypsibius exemplaris]|uniref:Uncharacterized protein n=1 Tax=Hypsibius exemplaris TaxID=2072580 RepID=A0A9X6RN59_HYPEX|nr:hypothetical protein BV898_18584 [Hypsibius exemplaris]